MGSEPALNVIEGTSLFRASDLVLIFYPPSVFCFPSVKSVVFMCLSGKNSVSLKDKANCIGLVDEGNVL